MKAASKKSVLRPERPRPSRWFQAHNGRMLSPQEEKPEPRAGIKQGFNLTDGGGMTKDTQVGLQRRIQAGVLFRRKNQGLGFICQPGHLPVVFFQDLTATVHRPDSNKKVGRADHVAEEIGPVRNRQDTAPERMKVQPERLFQELFDLVPISGQNLCLLVNNNHIVNIPDVPPGLQCVLRELIQGVEVNIGKKLARQVPDGKPPCPAAR